MTIQAETLELLEWHRLCQHLSTFAATKLGAIAARHLKLPATKGESRQLLDQTEEVYQLEQKLEAGWSFAGIEDIGGALERAERGGLLSGEELLAVATTLVGVRRLRRTIDSQEDLPALAELVATVRTYPELEQEIYRCIDEGGKVANRASSQLTEIRSRLKTIRDQIYQKLQAIIHQHSKAVQEAVIAQRGDDSGVNGGGRFVIPVKATHQDRIPGIVHDTSSTGATLYIEPQAVVGLGNQLRQYRRQERVEEEKILKNLTELVRVVVLDLEQLLAAATALDLATARARYSRWLEANPPRFLQGDGGESIHLRQLRHPLLLWQQHHEQGTAVVPINVQIDPSMRVVTITGPNTGGKTVTLKTIGLAMLMAKAGLFVPATDPVQLPWFEQVLADIGDEQSLQQNLSTFSGHIRRIVRIIEALSSPASSSSPSLVLLDEIGAGTDPAEGSALAIALLQYLADRDFLTIATTHYGELKALKYQDRRFENASVEFDDSTLAPTYRLLWGIPGRSNALTIARRLGLKSEIVEAAKNQVGQVSQEINEVIAGLERERQEQERKAEEASQLLQKTERFYGEVSAKASSLQQRERELKQQQEREVQRGIAAAKAEIAQVIRQLQQGSQTAQKAQKATEALDRIAQQYLPQPQQRQPRYHPQVGERVKIPSLGQTAEVIGLEEEEGEVTVRFGLMKMTVPLTEIESLDGKKADIPAKSSAIPVNPPPSTGTKPTVALPTSQNTIDLRGSRVTEAEVALEGGIARATAAGVLWIIHGKGTGKLRQGVHQFLQQHPQVERFELAPQQEGGTGVTVAYLK